LGRKERGLAGEKEIIKQGNIGNGKEKRQTSMVMPPFFISKSWGPHLILVGYVLTALQIW
jgi:hypothetical protein